jgi:hypothetical protein
MEIDAEQIREDIAAGRASYRGGALNSNILFDSEGMGGLFLFF